MQDIALAGASLEDAVAEYPTQVSPWVATGRKNIVLVLFMGTNDLKASRTLASMTANLDSYVALALADSLQLIVCTVPPSLEYGASQETTRLGYNTYVKTTNFGSRVKVADLAAQPEFQDPSDTTYFNDGTHIWTGAGQNVICRTVLAQAITIPF